MRYAVSLGLLAVLAVLTWQQSRIYANPEILYRDTIQKNPESWMAENNLSTVLLDQGRLEESAGHAEQALQLRPNYPEAQVNLGNVFLKQNRPDEAIEHYRASLRLESRLPKTHNNLGNALRLKGEFGGAIKEYQRTIQLDPRNLSAKNNLAWLLATCSDVSLRDGAKAVDLALGAERLSRGTNAIVLHTLAAAYAQNRQFPEAVATAERALQLATAQNNAELATALHQEIGLYESGSAYAPPR
jgi:tetratricopeptide (TPR) repeat protein